MPHVVVFSMLFFLQEFMKILVFPFDFGLNVTKITQLESNSGISGKILK